VAAAIATYRRPAELTRLLRSLAASDPPLDGGIFVADNASETGVRDLCGTLGARWLPRENSGPGPGWNTAARAALEDSAITHLLVLDDDVVPGPETTSLLLGALGGKGAAAPLLFDGKDRLWAFPEPREKGLRPAIRRVHSPSECMDLLGAEPHPFTWATGACMLYTKRAFEEAGGFREDFWMLGEDLDLSMRVASSHGGVFTAAARVPHLPPSPAEPAAAGQRRKFLALLQNLSYLSFHSPHSAHMRSYLAGNFKRYVLTEGVSPAALRDAWRAFADGALRARPSGARPHHSRPR
jgi:GT2 family glycosyltransferase